MRWAVEDDDGGGSCPDCDDNSLAGPQLPGTAFPTGHSHPPVHPGLPVPARARSVVGSHPCEFRRIYRPGRARSGGTSSGSWGRWSFLIVAVIVVQGLANFYTNYLWYRSVHFTDVWRLMIETKLELAGVLRRRRSSSPAGSACGSSTASPRGRCSSRPSSRSSAATSRSSPATPSLLRTVVSLILALIVGVSTDGQWQHWLMFRSGKSFGATDPQFHKAVGFYVFKLPFLSFLVDWTLVALLADPHHHEHQPLPERRPPVPGPLAPGRPTCRSPTCR